MVALMTNVESIPPPGIDADRERRLDARAALLLRRRRKHIWTIRKRSIVAPLAVFAASWVVIGVQLVSGNDPALSKGSNTTVVAGPPRKSKNSSTTRSSVYSHKGSAPGKSSDSTMSTSLSSASTSSGSAGSSSAGTATQQPAPVTTRQS